MNNNCSLEIMTKVINNSLAVVPVDFLLQKGSEPTISGLVRYLQNLMCTIIIATATLIKSLPR